MLQNMPYMQTIYQAHFVKYPVHNLPNKRTIVKPHCCLCSVLFLGYKAVSWRDQQMDHKAWRHTVVMGGGNQVSHGPKIRCVQSSGAVSQLPGMGFGWLFVCVVVKISIFFGHQVSMHSLRCLFPSAYSVKYSLYDLQPHHVCFPHHVCIQYCHIIMPYGTKNICLSF